MHRAGLIICLCLLFVPAVAAAQDSLHPRGLPAVVVGPMVPIAAASSTPEQKVNANVKPSSTSTPPIKPVVPVVNREALTSSENSNNVPLPESNKLILVSLNDQTLTYFEGTQMVGQFKISSGIKTKPTPPGEYTVLAKKPVVNYKGPDY